MRALILSDIHGSGIAARQALTFFEKFNCDKIFLLGDTLYHGPRNPLPAGHGPMAVVEALEPYKEKIVAVRGNCDADVDLMMLDFPIEDEYAVVEDGDIHLFLSHGHIFMPECFPKDALDCIERTGAHATSRARSAATFAGATGDAANATEDATAATEVPRHASIDAYLFGHTHIWQLEKNFRDVLMVNPGSTSLPKGGNTATFGFYESFSSAKSGCRAKFSIHNLEDGAELDSVEI